MFISSLLQGDKPSGENWRWVQRPETWDPLHEHRPHFRMMESIALFESEQHGGLGIEPAPKLLDARIRVAGQMYACGGMQEGSRLMSFDEARRIYPWLSVGARTEWDRTVASLEDRLDAGTVPEREAHRAWDQRGLCVGGGTVELSGSRTGEMSSTDEVNEHTLHEAIRRALASCRAAPALVQQARWRSSVSSRLLVEHSPPLFFHGLHPFKRVIHRAALEAR